MKKLLLLFTLLCTLFISSVSASTDFHDNNCYKLSVYLKMALTPDEYGGIYYEEGKYHIKPMKETREKIEKIVVEKEKEYGMQQSDFLVDKYDADYSIRELADALGRLEEYNRTSKNSRILIYYNLKQNGIDIYNVDWTEVKKEQFRELAGINNLGYELSEGNNLPGITHNFLIRFKEKEVEWYGNDAKADERNYICNGYLSMPIYQKDGEFMFPLKEMLNTSKKYSSISWDNSKGMAHIRFDNSYYDIQPGKRTMKINGVEREIEESWGKLK